MKFWQILKQYPTLTANGFTDPTDPNFAKWRAELTTRPDDIEAAQQWVSQFPKSTTARLSSYHAKHILEYDTGRYVDEGSFIVGAILAGFTPGTSAHGPAGFLNIDRRALNRFIKSKPALVLIGLAA
tara:strand:+ start:954 stop:1334 length:381 start_codon:yes stop_codon:yes gene_type:complete